MDRIGIASSADQVCAHSSSQTERLHAAFQVGQALWRDVEIDPHAVRADFEFLVVVSSGWVRLKEDFRDVTIPEFVAASVGSESGKTNSSR